MNACITIIASDAVYRLLTSRDTDDAVAADTPTTEEESRNRQQQSPVAVAMVRARGRRMAARAGLVCGIVVTVPACLTVGK